MVGEGRLGLVYISVYDDRTCMSKGRVNAQAGYGYLCNR